MTNYPFLTFSLREKLIIEDDQLIEVPKNNNRKIKRIILKIPSYFLRSLSINLLINPVII